MYGGGKYQLTKIDDQKYQNKLAKLNKAWVSLKEEIQKVRENGYENTNIINMSEDYFYLADETVTAAENYSQHCASQLNSIEKGLIVTSTLIVCVIIRETILAIVLMKRNKELSKLAYIDLHTGLPNRSRVEELVGEYNHFDQPSAMIVFVLNDLKEDVYEDLKLNAQHFQQIKDIEHELEMAKELKDLDYQDECRSLCRYCLDFFESLGLDSDEIEALNEAQSFFDQQDSQENQQLEGAKRWVDEMMSNYQNGDTGMYDQMKSTMGNLGIDEEKLKNISNEEVNQYVQDMCKKFGISQSLFDKLKDKFGR